MKQLRDHTCNNLDLAGQIGRDIDCHAELRMIHTYSTPLHTEYTGIIETTRTGLGSAEAAAGRACGDWHKVLTDTIRLVADPDKLRYCRIDIELNLYNKHSWATVDEDRKGSKPPH